MMNDAVVIDEAGRKVTPDAGVSGPASKRIVVAYGAGVMSGAVRSRSLGALKPHITKSTLGLRTVLGLKPGAGNQ